MKLQVIHEDKCMELCFSPFLFIEDFGTKLLVFHSMANHAIVLGNFNVKQNNFTN